ncbi:hypothetical protein LZ757_08955 [Xylella fastidiosa subsp. morus]|nr:hypothetical protein [Xylella fastidiosa]EWG14528.1 hypothetical protein P910_002222 [Xylella fastidiosa Mul-MD]AIC13565.1 hypothetical protein P303_02340 [Xylella fastidiosa MUL0034]UIN27297.1 hypothetical protein IUD23_08250 [Xylella fastidiosa subsp. morus]UIT36171.1 hypothetical protein LZ757_08955 [Xylella fastidiosa subsp. morus]UIT38464.1 hypothetical protein LZ755_08980 [Xylella fastidiosa subsp. morus]
MYFMDLDCEITGDVLGSKEQGIRLIIKTMRALSVSEVSEVFGGNALTDWTSIVMDAVAFVGIMNGFTSPMFLGAFADTGGLIGVAWGGAWMAGTFIHKNFISMYPTIFKSLRSNNDEYG